jgi:two-component system, chemotaxis family, sensor kinase CheA
VREKALEKGLIASERAAHMTPQEIIQLVFSPGFSTVDTVTQLSGRGVGLDVVKTNIEKIGGTILLDATMGQGTTIHIRIPLTLAIIPALMVRCGMQRYAIPQGNLVELIRVEQDSSAPGIEYVHGVPVHRLRGDLLPLVFLRDALELGKAGDDSRCVDIVVLQEQKQQFGLVIDEVVDTQEIVVKPLGKQLKSVDCFAGATIMGDGRVALIIDVQGIARHCGLLGKVIAARSATPRDEQPVEGGSERLVIFSVGAHDRMALPLARVQRLEEFAPGSVERAGDRSVVQYRGNLLPLVDLREHFGAGRASIETPSRVIVYGPGERSVGFVVGEIVDIVEETVRLERCTDQPGIAGSAVVAGRVTDFLDPDAITALARIDLAGVGPVA